MRRTDYLFLRPGSRNWHVKLAVRHAGVGGGLLGTPNRACKPKFWLSR